MSASQSFGFGDSLLEMEMLQTMQGIGMNERADRALFVENLGRMHHL
jgi:hypothetical protein